MRFEVRRPEDFGTALKEFRTVRGLNQADLARRVGLNRTYLSGMEQGDVPAYVERLIALTQSLGLTITITDS
jgi:transcriptional regulator with XRE-family HTH domain